MREAVRRGFFQAAKLPEICMSELRFPEWQRPLQEVILESGQEDWAHKIQAVEKLITLRFLQLQNRSDCLEERQALSDALFLLGLLRKRAPQHRSSAA